MLDTFLSPTDQRTAVERVREWPWAVWYALLLAITVAVGFVMLRSDPVGPDPVVFAWTAYILGAIVILWKPKLAPPLILFLTLVGDVELTPGYPFTKNFSSRESLFYINDSIIVNPLEFYLLLALAAWIFHSRMKHELSLRLSELVLPGALFLGFIVFGLVYGLGVKGGDVKIGLWEARPILYLPIMLFLVNQLVRTPAEVKRLVIAAVLAIVIEGIIGSFYFFNTLGASLEGVDRITEHSAAIHMNTLFLFAVAAWLFRLSWSWRLSLPLLSLVVVIPYLATQRRAAFITLSIALALTLIVLFWENRRLFWTLIPIAVIGGLGYLAVFWNSGSVIALPAQAVKSIVVPGATSAEDYSSNLYRLLENANIDHTIHQAPLLGVGFGRKFLVSIAMPDISFFEWWEYITHNSILWIWMKTGIGGFISMLFLVGMAVLVGAQTLWKAPSQQLKAIAYVGVLYVIMHFLFAYVDMSWDNQSMVYLGAMMGVLSSLPFMFAKDKEARWPWRTSRRLVADLQIER